MRLEVPPPHTSPKILVAEDEPALRELVRACLGSGYRYLEAADGETALELARSAAPDLIVLDLMLPRLTGLEVLSRVRRERRPARVAVLVLTAQPALLGEARAAGADEAMSKPFEPEAFVAAVEALLERRAAAHRAA